VRYATAESGCNLLRFDFSDSPDHRAATGVQGLPKTGIGSQGPKSGIGTQALPKRGIGSQGLPKTGIGSQGLPKGGMVTNPQSLPKGTTTKTGPDSVNVNRNVNLGNTNTNPHNE
jgi:hypothetical protein